jgi:hypothetical protein
MARQALVDVAIIAAEQILHFAWAQGRGCSNTTAIAIDIPYI